MLNKETTVEQIEKIRRVARNLEKLDKDNCVEMLGGPEIFDNKFELQYLKTLSEFELKVIISKTLSEVDIKEIMINIFDMEYID